MKITHSLIAIMLFVSLSVNGQSYFYSTEVPKSFEEPPEAETTVDSVDTAMVEFPDVAKDVMTVALPLDNLYCTSPFGIRRDPMNRKSQRMHNGMDLRAHYERVYAMLPGTVIATGYSRSGGNYVTISHGVCVCSYLHLSKILVGKGQHVSAGDVVAVSGNSGARTTGAHLHISCRMNDRGAKYFNPLLLFKFIYNHIASSL